MDETKLHEFVGQMLSDLGGAASVALVRIGDALGLYKTLHAKGPMTIAEMAVATGLAERYLREWASHQTWRRPRRPGTDARAAILALAE